MQIKTKENGQKSKDGVKSIKNKLRFILNCIHTVDFLFLLIFRIYLFFFEAHSHQVLNNSMQGQMKAAETSVSADLLMKSIASLYGTKGELL